MAPAAEKVPTPGVAVPEEKEQGIQHGRLLDQPASQAEGTLKDR